MHLQMSPMLFFLMFLTHFHFLSVLVDCHWDDILAREIHGCCCCCCRLMELLSGTHLKKILWLCKMHIWGQDVDGGKIEP